jgi:hypothetical protein
MKDVFISYAREDAEVAKKLFSALTSEGFSVWWDQEIPPGKTFDEVINDHLKQSRCVLVLWSSHSISSNWVLDEAAEAQSLKKLIPVMIENVDIPMGFRRLQAAKLLGWNGRRSNNEFQLLVKSIASLLQTSDTEKERVNSLQDKSQQQASDPKLIYKAGRWMKYVIIIITCFYYIGIVINASRNDDIVMFSALFGFPALVYMLFMKKAYRIAWLTFPLISYLTGMPFGHNYGTMTKSPVFGLEQGTNCQPEPLFTILLVILIILAFIDHYLYLKMKKN